MNIKKCIKYLQADINRHLKYRNRESCKTSLEYFLNGLSLFFDKTSCFRSILYFRLGRIGNFFQFFFRPYYSELHIFCKDAEGGSIFCFHAWSTVINCRHIGYGCTFMQNTTIGAGRKNGKIVTPFLGNNVYVGANSVIIGDVHIGNNVKIGAGTVVTKSIPDNCVVVGNPARIIKRDGILTNENL